MIKEKVLDCTGLSYGKVLEQTATWIRGLDSLDYHTSHLIERGCPAVKLLNIDKVKPIDPFRKVFRHSGYASGFKVHFAKDLLQKNPIKLFKKSLAGYLPKNKSSRHLIKRVKVFASDKNETS